MKKSKPLRLIGVNFYQVESRLRGEDLVEIPPDMLRYDLGFISPTFPGVVAIPSFRSSAGQLGGHVTRARWQSFVLDIKLLTDLDLNDLAQGDFRTNPSRWTTYQHARTDTGPTDYSKLQPFTLRHYLTVPETALCTAK